MPDISGFEVCQTLKDDTTLCTIPVIFLTASDGISHIKSVGGTTFAQDEKTSMIWGDA
ncbi:MAG: hypothetical protein MAG551_02645 [Candidatus Scalindua arabica]|uniref:Response regulatory domain-containing protein n=1 Tax=Candidatus Scalindua arabica TaxID=1127984 RepID=A0A941W556_9BACT|nr:hypothetical protein [Candidatus Scalindua arabica]